MALRPVFCSIAVDGAILCRNIFRNIVFSIQSD